ncbi:hypothetical protein B0O99DRAFT_676973 [Bisporella sp. PMI_857]|nr:hypothetical protein B0O99DRAFT_676973 [Bisporella sp. PMI_857]
MDHFPIPKDGRHIRVPNKTVQEYSKGNGGFAGYPARCGWSPEDLKGTNNFGNRSGKEVEAFFQTWLYFGAVIEVLDIADVSASTTDFISPSKNFVTSRHLPAKLRRVKKNASKTSEEWRNQWHMETSEILGQLSKYLGNYYNTSDIITDTKDTKWPVSEEISMSIIALVYTLGEGTADFYGKSASHKLPTSALLRRRMIQAGWCPTDVQRIERDMSIDGHYYIATLSKPLGNLSHKKCTSLICTSNLVSEDDYLVKHTDECCTCEHCRENHVQIDLAQVLKIIDAGGFPIVSWIASENRLDVKEFNAEKGNKPIYVAISHVWADGMGNPKTNSLPRCQIVRLQRLVNNISSQIESPDRPISFWMDTLCVPVASDLKSYRILSIRKMKDIYKSASAVLVVESLMVSTPWEGSDYDKSLSIYFSNWNKRLWTFQEGMFAQKLMLQFADRALDHRDDINFHEEHKKSISQGHCVTFPYRATTAVMSEFVILRDFIDLGFFGTEDFQALAPMISQIQHRTTSRLSDQTLCACVILGKDPGPLFKVGIDKDNKELKGEELEDRRMETFLKMIGKFPPSVIFNKCPRLKQDGFRWAPRTFLGIPKNGFLEDVEGEAAVLTDDQGLVVKYAGFITSGLIPGGNLVQTLCILPQEKGSPVQVQVELHPNNGPIQDHDNDKQEQLAVIFRYPLDLGTSGRTPASLALPSQNAVVGIVQAVTRDDKGGVEHIQIKHKFLARITTLNPSVFPTRPGPSDDDPVLSLLKQLQMGPPFPSTGPPLPSIGPLLSSMGPPLPSSGPIPNFDNKDLKLSGSGYKEKLGTIKHEQSVPELEGEVKKQAEIVCELLCEKTQWYIS